MAIVTQTIRICDGCGKEIDTRVKRAKVKGEQGAQVMHIVTLVRAEIDADNPTILGEYHDKPACWHKGAKNLYKSRHGAPESTNAGDESEVAPPAESEDAELDGEATVESVGSDDPNAGMSDDEIKKRMRTNANRKRRQA